MKRPERLDDDVMQASRTATIITETRQFVGYRRGLYLVVRVHERVHETLDFLASCPPTHHPLVVAAKRGKAQ